MKSMAKSLEIQQLIRQEKLDLLAVNETNLKSDIDTDTLNLPQNYTFLRNDRSSDSGRGGCGVLISKNLKFKQISLKLRTKTDNIESIWVNLVDLNIYVCCFYRSQNFCPVDLFLDYMTECMMNLNNKKVIWIGDINIDQNNIRDMSYRKLDITLKLFGMVQTIREITRVSHMGNIMTQTTIDVIMTNCYSKFVNCNVLDNRIGDHQAIKCVLDFNVIKTSKFKKILIRDHSGKNIRAFSDFLGNQCDFSPITKCTDINLAAEGLSHHMTKYYEVYCPIKTINVHNNYLFKPSNELLGAIKRKRILYRKYKKHKLLKHMQNDLANCNTCTRLWNEFKHQKNHVTKLSRANKRQNIITDLKAKSAKNDLKGIWKPIKRASNISPGVGNSNVTCNLDPNEVNNFFTSIGPNIQANIPQHTADDNFMDYMDDPTEHKLETFDEISENQVLDYIHSIPRDKSINDIIPTKVYRCILPKIIEPFTHIVNLSLKYGIMPDICKKAMVTPIFKAGDVDDPGNYRPISILPILGKTIEYFVNQQLVSYVESNNILSKQQYGFRKNHSTAFLMLDLFDGIYSAKSKSLKPGILFLDIKKAFDTVNHNILLKKLENYGIGGYVLRWLKSFLTNRWQQTKIGSLLSNHAMIKCGVPQGSILGPILFSIFINDFTRACKNSTPFLFADDGALYFNHIVRSCYSNVKDEMKNIYKWLRINRLALNINKTSILIFDKSDNLDAIQVEIGQHTTAVIIECKTQKYLGLMVDHKLKFSEHIEYIKKKVSKRIGAMYRSKKLLPLQYRKMFANALMLPQFDYLDIIWCKANKSKLDELDIIYKKVAKIALDVNIRENTLMVYQTMKWLPLHIRRQLHLAAYMYRIINGLSPKTFMNKFAYISGGSRDGNNCNLYTNKSRTHKEFYYIGAKCWNLIPQPLRNIGCVKDFSDSYKKRLMNSILSDQEYKTDNKYDKLYKLLPEDCDR